MEDDEKPKETLEKTVSFETPLPGPPGKASRSESIQSSNEFSTAQTSDGGDYQVVELDDEFIQRLPEELQIEDNSPAAEALRANANVKVSTVGKAARAVHMQSVRKLIKRATLSTKQGNVRGKPPRVPLEQGEEVSLQAHQDSMREEEVEESDEDDGRIRPQDVDSADAMPDQVVRGTAEAGRQGT